MQQVNDVCSVVARVAPLAERVTRRVGCELVKTSYVSERGGWVLRVVIDRGGGVNVDDCAAVSRQLSALLDVEDPIPGTYTLEVSSPGLERELLVASDYRRYAGRIVRIESDVPVQGRRLIRGVLQGIRRGTVQLTDPSGGRVEVPLERVTRAQLETEN